MNQDHFVASSAPSNPPPTRLGGGKNGTGVRQFRPVAGKPWPAYAAAGWSALLAVLGTIWALGGPAFPATDGLLTVPHPRLAGLIVAVTAALGVGAALWMARHRRGYAPAVYGGLLVILPCLLINSRLITSLGYTVPVIVGIAAGKWTISDFFTQLYPWPVMFQVLCLAGTALWFTATLRYVRRIRNACEKCGRTHDDGGWTSRTSAARWGRVAAYASMVPPCLYAMERFAWALGIPLGGSKELVAMLHQTGGWVMGASLGTMAMFGVVMTFGLIHRWGEVFPRWTLWLSGRRVPVAFPVTCFVVAGMALVTMLPDLIAAILRSGGTAPIDTANGVLGLATMLLLPLWGVGLIVATAGYYLRRRGGCSACGYSSIQIA